MRKYATIFSIAWENEFVYRLNFILWRFRNVLRLLMTFFLWRGIFVTNPNVFGYTQTRMLTYVFLVLVVQTVVLSAPSADNIGGEIGNGDLSNYLVKPMSYLKYWFTRDLASKLLNISFASVEAILLFIILSPTLQFPSKLLSFLGFLVSLTLAVILYFLVNVATKFVAFWTPENTWGITFLTLVLIEILAGGIFPLDVLPQGIKIVLQFTPFPYLVYFPIAIFVGKITGIEIIRVLVQASVWIIVMRYLVKLVWRRGLVAYSSEGR